ncbi:MAG: hypothetical protein HN348_05160 [Proteobacteria bacterium]|jgi:hypothetical protein|nr:hypothetical protein [Pseudomonadota bacterium]
MYGFWFVSLLSVGCTPSDDHTVEGYRPSLTMLRTGEVVVDEPPPIPEDLFIPGVVVNQEDYVLPGEMRSATMPTDLTAMEELDDPSPLTEHQEDALYAYAAGIGSVFDENAEQRLEYDDVVQGSIGDCYFVAALSSVFYADKSGDISSGMIREVHNVNGEVTRYVVRFYDAYGRPQDIEVDADLVRKNGRVLYARSADTEFQDEEWGISLVEKAYAEWHGNYDKIGNGGFVGDALQALTGATANYRRLNSLTDAALMGQIQSTCEANRPVTASTHGKDSGVDYEGTGVYAWHAYTVLGADDDGVHLRNPWGRTEPAGNGPDDGIFQLDLGEFRRLYKAVAFGGGTSPDTTAPFGVVLTAGDVIDEQALVRFTATGDDGMRGLAAKYDVRISKEPIEDEADFEDATPIPAADPQSPGTEEQIAVPVESPEVWVALRVLDEVGNASRISDTVLLRGDAAPEMIQFDVEDGEDGWEATGLFHRSTRQAISGEKSWWFGDPETGDYNTGERVKGSLTSPVLDLVGMSAPRLSWNHVLAVEINSQYDIAVVETATEAGEYQDWDVVWEKDTTTKDFKLQEAELLDVGGQKVMVRFRFDSVDSGYNSYEGWLIDDITIYEPSE